MNEHLIESVRAVAKRMPIIKTCKPMPVRVRQDGLHLARPQDYDECDMRLVLQALDRAERIESAARTLQERMGIYAKALDVLNLVPVYSKDGREMLAVFAAESAVSSAQAMLRAALSEPQ